MSPHRSHLRTLLLSSTLIAGAFASFGLARQDSAPAKATVFPDLVEPSFFGNSKCPLTGQAIKSSKFATIEGQKVYFCCPKCITKAKEDPKGALAKAYAEVQKVNNAMCPVSGHAVEAGKGKEVSFQGRAIQLCCPKCEEAFTKDPLLTVAKAMCPDLKMVGNKTCPMMKDEKIDPAFFVIYKKQLVNFCCGDCIEDFKANPEESLAAANKLK